MEDMKDLPSLGYTGAQEKLAEKFHMSEELLGALNPGEQFDTAGRTVVVASKLGGEIPPRQVAWKSTRPARPLRSSTEAISCWRSIQQRSVAPRSLLRLGV